MLNRIIYTRLCTVFVFCTIILVSEAQEVIVVDDSKSRGEKTALVVLNGFGDSKKNRRVQTEFFTSLDYDLFIPEFILRHSLDESLDAFSDFYREQRLDEYDEVKVMCYIIGGYVLNRHIEKEGFGQISTIIYDRSPIQERAPIVAVDRICLISKIVYGDVLLQFSKVEITPLESTEGVEVGLIIENKATSLMRKFQKAANKYGEYNFLPDQIDGNLDDYFHTVLDHDEMYVRFDVIGDEIKYFLENGRFTQEARRDRYEWDPFKKRKP
jgi:hypothetical protein